MGEFHCPVGALFYDDETCIDCGMCIARTKGEMVKASKKIRAYLKEHANKKNAIKKIAVCGKGGVGKSTTVTLMANALRRKNYDALVLDTDESNPGLYRIFPFMASGFFSALVGVIMSGRVACGDPKIAEGWELDAIAAVVIGGTSLFGGRGGIGETVVGVLIMGLIINIMNLLEISAYPQQMVKGVIIILALASQNFMSKRSYA